MGCITSKNTEVVLEQDLPPVMTGWTHLAFSGGGANGVLYAGAYRAAWDTGVIQTLQGAAGTSIGSLFATLAVLRVPPAEIRDKILELDTDRLMDNSWFPVDDAIKFVRNMGLYRGRYLESWCEDVISRHTGVANCTFAQLYAKTRTHLKICTCNESRGEVEYWDHLTRPDVPVARAIRTSASIPFMYDPVLLGEDYFIDGGVCDIFPLDAFGNTTTLGFLLLNNKEQKSSDLVRRQPVTNLLEHAVAVYACMAAAQFALQHPGTEWTKRTIALQGPNKSLWDFSFTRDDKRRWIDESYRSAVADMQYYRDNGSFP